MWRGHVIPIVIKITKTTGVINTYTHRDQGGKTSKICPELKWAFLTGGHWSLQIN